MAQNTRRTSISPGSNFNKFEEKKLNGEFCCCSTGIQEYRNDDVWLCCQSEKKRKYKHTPVTVNLQEPTNQPILGKCSERLNCRKSTKNRNENKRKERGKGGSKKIKLWKS